MIYICMLYIYIGIFIQREMLYTLLERPILYCLWIAYALPMPMVHEPRPCHGRPMDDPWARDQNPGGFCSGRAPWLWSWARRSIGSPMVLAWPVAWAWPMPWEYAINKQLIGKNIMSVYVYK